MRPARLTGVVIHALFGLLLLVFLTVFDQQLILHEVLPLHGVVVFASLASVTLIVAAATRTIELGEVYSEAVHILSRFRLFAIGFLALVLLSLIHLVIPPLPSLTDALYIASPLAVCALTVLLSSIPQIRTSLRSYLFVAFAVYCVTVWVDVLRPATFSAMESQASGFASNPNAGALLLVMLTAPLLNYRRLTLTSLLLLFVSGLTAFTILSRAGLLGYLVLAGCYTWMIPAPYLKRRLVNFALVGVMGLGVLSASLISVRTLSYFDDPVTKARVHLVFGTGSLEHAATIVCRVAGSEECPDWIQRLFSFEVDPLVDVTTDYARIRDLLNGLRRIKEAPILGHGPRFDGRSESGSHNMYVSVWVNLGVGAPIAYLMILMGGIWSFRAVGFRAGVALLSFIAFWSLFSHTMFDKRPLFIMLGLLLPLAAARSPERERDRDAPPPAGPGPPAHPVRVLMVSALPPPPGGIQTWTKTLYERGMPPPFEIELVDTRVTRRHQDVPPRLSPAEAKRFLRILWQIRRSLRSGRFSVMHLNCSLTRTAAPRNVASALIARRAGVPYVAHLRGTFSVPAGNHIASRLYRWAYRTIFDGAASILALGQPSYRSILELGDYAHKTRPLLPNFVDFRAVPEPDPGSDRHEGLRVIFTGALVEPKGVYTVVEAAKLVRGAHFRLVGDAPPDSRAALFAYVREQGLQDRVRLLGPVTGEEIMAMLGESDVFLFPSKGEGFPNSVSEAMAAGLPVVASTVGAIPEMIDVPQGGFLASPGDAAGYVEALTRLRDDPALRAQMGRYNRDKAIREYDYDTVVGDLCEIYSRISESKDASEGTVG